MYLYCNILQYEYRLLFLCTYKYQPTHAEPLDRFYGLD